MKPLGRRSKVPALNTLSSLQGRFHEIHGSAIRAWVVTYRSRWAVLDASFKTNIVSRHRRRCTRLKSADANRDWP